MQAMNLHPAQQDVLLNLLNVQPGKAQGMSNTPQGEMSFSSMLERADKTYSTEGKNTQKPQDASPKTEAPSRKEDEPREDSRVRNEKADDGAQKTESRNEVKQDDKTQAFDEDKANADIEKLTADSENVIADEMVKGGEAAEHACLTMPDSDEIAEGDSGKPAVVIPSENLDAEALENTEMADKNALAARLESKPVTAANEASESEKAASHETEATELSSDKKTKKKNDLPEANDAAALIKTDAAQVKAQEAPDAESTVLAAMHTKAEGANSLADKIEVIDERTHADPAEFTLNTTTTLNPDGSSAEMVMTLPVQAASSEANGSLEAGFTKADFSQMLTNSVAASKDEFVKTGSIILQNNKKGSINLILHPEELGNVKVKLELSDNQITGKIVVASKEAYDAFKQNLEDIKNAFVANGFDACGFDLAWAGTGNGDGSQGQNSADNGSMNQFGLQYFGNMYEDNIPDSVPEYYAENSHINLVA